MKKRLLRLTTPFSFLLNVLSKEPPGHISLKNNSFFFADTNDSACQKMSWCIKTGFILSFRCELQHMSGTFACTAFRIDNVFN